MNLQSLAAELFGEENCSRKLGAIYARLVPLKLACFSPLVSMQSVFKRLGNDVRASAREDFRDRLDHSSFYVGTHCAKNWIDLVEDTSGYPLGQQSKQMVQQSVDDLVAIMHTVHPGEWDFVSLGVGDAHDDCVIIEKLTERFSPKPLFYFAVDISADLLVNAMRHINEVTLSRIRRTLCPVLVNLDFKDLKSEIGRAHV